MTFSSHPSIFRLPWLEIFASQTMPSIRFQCPNCSVKLSAEPDQFGTPASCPECEWTFYVPHLEGENRGSAIVKFFCPHCNRKLSATEKEFATEMPCPFADCGKPVLVPRPDWKSMPTTILRKGAPDAKDLIAKAESINRNPNSESA